VFVWTGDPARADPARVPSFHKKLGAPGWHTINGYALAQGGYRLILDNLLDLSHLAYVHLNTIGTAPYAERAVVTATKFAGGVRLQQEIRDVPAPPAYAKNYTGNIDHWQVMEYYPPSCFFLRHGNSPAAKPDEAVDISSYEAVEVYHLITPETATTGHDFWGRVGANVFHGDARVAFEQKQHQVIGEDMAVYEAQQAAILARRSSSSTDVGPSGALRTDQALSFARALLNRLCEAEQQEREPGSYGATAVLHRVR